MVANSHSISDWTQRGDLIEVKHKTKTRGNKWVFERAGVENDEFSSRLLSLVLLLVDSYSLYTRTLDFLTICISLINAAQSNVFRYLELRMLEVGNS